MGIGTCSFGQSWHCADMRPLAVGVCFRARTCPRPRVTQRHHGNLRPRSGTRGVAIRQSLRATPSAGPALTTRRIGFLLSRATIMSRPTHSQPFTRTSPYFTCCHCRQSVPSRALGTQHRNHCPSCLWSSHVDHTPGDRRCACIGAMEPVAIWVRSDGEWAIIHRCTRCNTLRFNRIAGDDDVGRLEELALRPLERPAFRAAMASIQAEGDR